MKTTPLKAVALVAFVALTGCENDTGIVALKYENIAVVAGDFDEIQAAFDRQEIAHQVYEGFTSTATYDEDIDPDMIALKVEALMGSSDELSAYDAVIVNSGVRGFGEYVYNGVDSDDGLVTDEAMIENVRSFVENGRLLMVSDWAYDLVEASWPDAIDFYGDDTLLDDAQAGSASTEGVSATVLDPGLQGALGSESFNVHYDYSYWSVIASVGDDVEVLLSGDVEVRISESEGYETLTDSPLLVAFDTDRGRVVYSTFHWRAQDPQLSDDMLLHVAQGLQPGTASYDNTGDTGAE
jgi:hypothetical protein